MNDAFHGFHSINKTKPPGDQPRPPTPSYKVFCPDGRVWEAHGWPKVVLDAQERPTLLFYDTPGDYEYGEMTAGYTSWDAFELTPVVMRERDGSKG